MRIHLRETSAFYRYHLWVRKLWWFDPPCRRTTSLCPIFQQTFWLTILTAVLGPLVLMGWLANVAVRGVLWVFDRWLCWKGLSVRVGSSPIGQLYRFGSEAVGSGAYALSGLLTLLMVAMGCGVVGVVALSIFCAIFYGAMGIWLGFWGLVKAIPQIPHALAVAAVAVGQVVFEFCYEIGILMDVVSGRIGTFVMAVVNGLVAFFTNYEMWTKVGVVSLWMIGAGIVVLVGCWIANSAPAQCLYDRFSEWLNRKSNCPPTPSSAYDEKKAKKEKALRDIMACLDERPAPQPSKFKLWLKGLFRSDMNVRGTVETVFTPFGLLWEFLKAVKKGVCPIVEIVSDDEIELSKNPVLQWTQNDLWGVDHMLARASHGMYAISGKRTLRYRKPTDQDKTAVGIPLWGWMILGEYDNCILTAEVHNRRQLAVEETSHLSPPDGPSFSPAA